MLPTPFDASYAGYSSRYPIAEKGDGLTYHSKVIAENSSSTLGARCWHRRSFQPFLCLDVEYFYRIKLFVVEPSCYHKASPRFVSDTTGVCARGYHGSQFSPRRFLPIKQWYAIKGPLAVKYEIKMIVRYPSGCVTTTGNRAKGIELTDAAIAKIWPVHVVIGNFFALNQASFNLCDLSKQPNLCPSPS